MKLKTISSVNLKGKRVVVRIDINSTIINGKPQDSLRFKESANTIKFLKKKKAKVILLAHQGRPGKSLLSLEKHSKVLNKHVKVRFLKEFPKNDKKFENLKEGEAVLLENIRFIKDEFSSKKINKITNLFKSFDYFVNDSFSISHRNQTSITGLPKILHSLMGLTFEKEFNSAKRIKEKSKNCLFILGGAKPSDIILLSEKKNILSTGKFSLLVLISKGFNLGRENILLKKYFHLIKEIKNKKIRFPTDLAYESKGRRKNLYLEELPLNKPLLDIGDDTIHDYVEEIKKAKFIFFKGAAGYFEDKRFAKGTKKILEAMSKSEAFTIVAGGDSLTALQKLKINPKKISHISLSGGALVHFIAGKKLPGLEALKQI